MLEYIAAVGIASFVGWQIYSKRSAETRQSATTPPQSQTINLKGDGGRYGQEVVGESFYTDAIAALDKKLGTPGKMTFCRAQLRLDDNNKHDNKAVAITIAGTQVGHLNKADARGYRNALAALGHPQATGECAAKIINHGDNIYSVWLDL